MIAEQAKTEYDLINQLFDISQARVSRPVNESQAILQKIKAHQESVRDKRQAPRLQQKLREDMKRFGL